MSTSLVDMEYNINECIEATESLRHELEKDKNAVENAAEELCRQLKAFSIQKKEFEEKCKEKFAHKEADIFFQEIELEKERMELNYMRSQLEHDLDAGKKYSSDKIGRVELEVSGIKFVTTKETLCSQSLYFQAMFSGLWNLHNDDQDSGVSSSSSTPLFLDRDCDNFNIILQYLRYNDPCILHAAVTPEYEYKECMRCFAQYPLNETCDVCTECTNPWLNPNPKKQSSYNSLPKLALNPCIAYNEYTLSRVRSLVADLQYYQMDTALDILRHRVPVELHEVTNLSNNDFEE